MKAISLWQPWASAIAAGSKRVETRHWTTNYRGPLIIHAAKRCKKSDLAFLDRTPRWMGALHPLYTHPVRPRSARSMPLGCLLAVCDLVDIRPSESFSDEELNSARFPPAAAQALLEEWHLPGNVAAELVTGFFSWTENQMGNFGPGRYGWVLDNLRLLPEPIPYKGGQGFFNVPDEMLRGDNW